MKPLNVLVIAIMVAIILPLAALAIYLAVDIITELIRRIRNGNTQQ
jgi:hypothetical protein